MRTYIEYNTIVMVAIVIRRGLMRNGERTKRLMYGMMGIGMRTGILWLKGRKGE